MLSFRTSLPGANNSNWYGPCPRRKSVKSRRASSKSNIENDQNVRNVQRRRSSVLNNKNKKEGKNASLKSTKAHSQSSRKHKGRQNSRKKGFDKTRQSRDGMKHADAAEIGSKGKSRKVQKECSQVAKMSSSRRLRFHRPKSQNLNFSQTPTKSTKQRKYSKSGRSCSRNRSSRKCSSNHSKSPNEHVDLSNCKRRIRDLSFQNYQSLPDHVQEQIISNRSTTESTKLQQFHSVQPTQFNISAEKLQQECETRQQDLLQTRAQLFEANFKIRALKKKLKESREARDSENARQMAIEQPRRSLSSESVQQMINENRKEDQEKIATLQNEVTSLKCYLSSYLSERQKVSEVSLRGDHRTGSHDRDAQVQTSMPFLTSLNGNSTQQIHLKTNRSNLTSTRQSQMPLAQEDTLSIWNQMNQFDNYTHISNQINNRNIVIQRQYAELLHKLRGACQPAYENDANWNARNVINGRDSQREQSANSRHLSQDRSSDARKYESRYGQRCLPVGDSACGQPQEVLKYINELELLMQQQSNNLIDLQQYHQIHKDNISNKPPSSKWAQNKNTYHLPEGAIYDEDQNVSEKDNDPKQQQRAAADNCLSLNEASVQYLGQDNVSSDVTVGMINGQQKEQQIYANTIQSFKKDGNVQNNQFQIINSRVWAANCSAPSERPSAGRCRTGGFDQQSNENFLDQENDGANEFEMNPQQIQLHDHNAFYRQSSRNLPSHNQSIDKSQTSKRNPDSAAIQGTDKSHKHDSTQQNIEQYSTRSHMDYMGAKRQSTGRQHDQNECLSTNGFIQYLLSEIQSLRGNTSIVIKQNSELQNENSKLKGQQQIDTLLKSIAAGQQFHRTDDQRDSKPRNMHPNLKNEPLSQIQPGLIQSPQMLQVRHQLNQLAPQEVTNSAVSDSWNLRTQSDKQQEQLVNKLKEYEDIFQFMKQQITTLESQVNQERSEKGPGPGDAGAQQSAGLQAGPNFSDAIAPLYIDQLTSQSFQQSKRVNQEAMDQRPLISECHPNSLPSPIRAESATENLQKYDELLELNSSISRKLHKLRRLSNGHNSKMSGTNNSKDCDDPVTEDIQMKPYYIVESFDSTHDQGVQQTTQTYIDRKHIRQFSPPDAYEQDSGPLINGDLSIQKVRQHRQSQGDPPENERIQKLEGRVVSSLKRFGPQRDLLDEQLGESSKAHSLIKQIQGANRETPPQADADRPQMRTCNNLIYTDSSIQDRIEIAGGIVGKVNDRDTNKSPQFRADVSGYEQIGSQQSDTHCGQINETVVESRQSVPRSGKSSYYTRQMSKNGNPEISSYQFQNTTSDRRQDLSNYRSSKLSSDHLEYLRNQQESNQNQAFILVQDSQGLEQSYLQALSNTQQTKSFQSTKSISEFNAQNYNAARMDHASQRSAVESEVGELMMLNQSNLQDSGLNRGQAILKTTDERLTCRLQVGDQTPNGGTAGMPNASHQVRQGGQPLAMDGEVKMFGSLTDPTNRCRSKSTLDNLYQCEKQSDQSSSNTFKDHHQEVEEIRETPRERASESNRNPQQLTSGSRQTKNDQAHQESLGSLMSERTKNLRQEISSLDQEIIDLQNSLNRAINNKGESN